MIKMKIPMLKRDNTSRSISLAGSASSPALTVFFFFLSTDDALLFDDCLFSSDVFESDSFCSVVAGFSSGLPVPDCSVDASPPEGFSVDGFSSEGFSVDGLSSEGLSVDGLSSEGLSVDGSSEESSFFSTVISMLPSIGYSIS